MTRAVLALVILASPAFADPRLDQHGDPLPDGAIVRFGTVRYRIGSSRTLWGWALAPDGKTLASEDRAGITFWDVDTGKPLRHFPPPEPSASGGKCELCYSPDSRYLVRSANGMIVHLDIVTGKPISGSDGSKYWIGTAPDSGRLHVIFEKDAPIPSRTYAIRKLSTSGKCLVVPSGTGFAIEDGASGKTRCVVKELASEKFLDLTLSHDDLRLYAARPDGSFGIFDAVSGKNLATVPASSGFSKASSPLRLAISTDGSRAFIAQEEWPIRQLDLKNNRWLEPLPQSVGEPIHCLPDGRRILQVGSDGVIHIFDVTTRKGVTPEGFEDSLFTLPSPSGHRVLAAHEDSSGKRLTMFDLSGRKIWTVTQNEWPSRQWSPDGKHLALTTKNSMQIHSAETGQLEQTLHSADENEMFMYGVFASDGRQLHAVLNFGRSVTRYDLSTGTRFNTVATGGRAASDGANDGRTLAIYSEDHGYALFDLESMRLRTDWIPGVAESRASTAGRAVISPDSSLVVFGEVRTETSPGVTSGTFAAIHDGGTLAFRNSLKVDLANENEVAISPNGQWLATADKSGTIRLRDAFSGEKLGTWSGHRDYITSLHFVGPSRLLTSSGDLTALLWDVRPKERTEKPLWDALTSGSVEAYRAIWALASDPSAPEILRKKIASVVAPDAAHVERWLADLDASRYAVRELATKELALRGRLIEPELRELRARTTSEEVRTRLDGLLRKLNYRRTDAEIVQSRAVAALEVAGTQAAKQLLREWASGARSAWLTIDAKAALSRLESERR